MTQTSALRVTSETFLFSSSISASSINTSAFQGAQRLNTWVNLDSRASGVVPNSPMLTTYRGTCSDSAIASAVRVLPTPAGPCNKKIVPS
eukprot:CAMPEP_0182593700 /NCGR_PEP_ID=MMETSP1324-20130603/78590_1 /TAXON_ID=236786 /ORGANISM="Florenciella sp., Strain RCC1587" /LENGTH=89 /DNA_ID=CAMNT_0024811181 /DNA_START=163 /DNA_END=429 /DNA_ORIENTATION=+